MAQNEKYVAPGGGKNNRTLAEGKKAVALLNVLGIQTFGIVALAAGGGERVEEADFEVNGIDSTLPANLEIRTSWGNGPDGDGQAENSIADAGEFRNVDKVLDWRASAQYPDQAARRLLSEVKPGLNDLEQINALMNLPGVAKAFGSAVAAALAKV